MKQTYFILLFACLLSMFGCDFGSKKKWVIAVPIGNSKYKNSAALLAELLNDKGLDVEINSVPSIIDAAALVAQGKADLTFSMAQSDFIGPKLGDDAKELRTVLPLFHNALFVFYRSANSPESIIDLIDDASIFLEVSDSLAEQRIGMTQFMNLINVDQYRFVADTAQATVMPVWSSFSRPLTQQMVRNKWKVYSMEESLIDYLILNEPRFERLTLPGRYPNGKKSEYNTIMTTSYLLTGSHVKSEDVYDLTRIIYDNRVFLTTHDKIYLAIKENFNIGDLNFPLHKGIANFLARNEPTFLERHAEVYGLIITVAIIAFGGFQSIRTFIAQKKKDRVDRYMLEYISIKNNSTMLPGEKHKLLEDLHMKALHQMINEKLAINDFAVLTQLLQAELNRE
jgi:TRAP-type uncharacterized transport system substrate-binding protein